MKTSENERTNLVQSAGRIFHDGIAMELIRNPSGNLKFLIWDGHTPKIVDQFKHGDVTYTPPQIHPSVRDSLVLPSGLADFRSTRNLYSEIAALISRPTGGSEDVMVPLSFLTFSCLFPEFAPVPAYVWVTVPATCSVGALKQLLGLLCRHSFVVNALSASWPSLLPMDLQPTLIGEVNSPSRRLLNTLRASQSHSVHSIRAGQVVDPCCAKVIFSSQPPEDPAAAGFPLEIVLPPAGEYVPPMDHGQARQVGEQFQNQLLAYRLANFSKIAPPSFDLRRFSAPVQALASSLAGAVIDDADLQSEIVPYLRELDSDIQNDSVTTVNARIVEVLVAHWNDRELGVSDVCGDVNTLQLARGYSAQCSPERIGWGLRALGLRTVHISGGLKGLKMADVRPNVTKLAATYGLSVPGKMSVHREAHDSSPVPELT